MRFFMLPAILSVFILGMDVVHGDEKLIREIISWGAIVDVSDENKLVAVSFRENVKLTDEKMKILGEVDSLKQMDLMKTGVGDTELVNIGKLRLEMLLLDENEKVGDEGMKVLGKMESLQFLFLSNTQVTDEGLRELTKLKNLYELNLAGTKATGAGVAMLAKLPIEWLYLQDVLIRDEDVKRFQEFKHLGHLDLSGCRVGEVGLESLKGMKSLKKVVIARGQVPDEIRLEMLRQKLYPILLEAPER